MEWISIKDDLPAGGQACIVYIPNVGIFSAWYNEEQYMFEFGGVNFHSINGKEYWMPIPTLPKID